MQRFQALAGVLADVSVIILPGVRWRPVTDNHHQCTRHARRALFIQADFAAISAEGG